MKVEIRDKWVEALRSGHYEQTTEVLQDVNGFCCLGVLVDVTHPELWVEGDGSIIFAGDDTAELGHDLLEELGLSNGEQQHLIRLNDTEGCDFVEIAEYIENHL